MPCPRNQIVFQLTSPQGDEPYKSIADEYGVSFQFTSPQGKETNHDACLFLYCHLRFQFTSPCGNERILIVWSNVPENFNSRLLGETNRNVKVLIHNNGISTHVSARRRTKRANEVYSKYIYFNSRLLTETNTG